MADSANKLINAGKSLRSTGIVVVLGGLVVFALSSLHLFTQLRTHRYLSPAGWFFELLLFIFAFLPAAGRW